MTTEELLENLEEESQELEELEDGSEGTEKDPPPKPLWEIKGYSSLEAMVADLEGSVQTERDARSAAEQALSVKPQVQPPVFQRDAYDEDPDGYSERFNQAVNDYLTSTKTPQYPASVLDAAVEGVLVKGEKSEINRHVLYGTMRSLVATDPNKKHMLDTPDGLRELGRLALEQFKTKEADKKADEEAPASHVQPKGSASAQSKEGKVKESAIDKLNKEIKTAAEEGRIDDVFDLTMKRNAAKLRKEKGVK